MPQYFLEILLLPPLISLRVVRDVNFLSIH